MRKAFARLLGGSWKLRSDGGVEWAKTYGERQDDFAMSVAMTAGGDYVVAGWTASFGAGITVGPVHKTDQLKPKLCSSVHGFDDLGSCTREIRRRIQA